MMKRKFIDYFMHVAEITAGLSHARKLKVGSVIVKDNRILSIGYNGTPAGCDNNCETEIYDENGEWSRQLSKEEDAQWIKFDLVTKPEVIHAEANAILKLAQSTDSAKDAVLFITHAPCIECAKMILSCGISSVIYKHEYRCKDGLDLLQRCNVLVYNYDSNNLGRYKC